MGEELKELKFPRWANTLLVFKTTIKSLTANDVRKKMNSYYSQVHIQLFVLLDHGLIVRDYDCKVSTSLKKPYKLTLKGQEIGEHFLHVRGKLNVL